jgi:hypothetical protein
VILRKKHGQVVGASSAEVSFWPRAAVFNPSNLISP